jgi:hypothetical protein
MPLVLVVPRSGGCAPPRESPTFAASFSQKRSAFGFGSKPGLRGLLSRRPEPVEDRRDITDRKLAEEALKEAQKVAEVTLTSQLS